MSAARVFEWIGLVLWHCEIQQRKAVSLYRY